MTMIRRACKTIGLAVTLAGLLHASLSMAVINQVDGEVVPVPPNLQACLDQHEGAGVMRAIYDADIQPEVYLPPPGVTVFFRDVGEGAGYLNSFGWYNVGDDVSVPANLHVIFGCRSYGMCACPCSTWRDYSINISASAAYKGGMIGFWIRTPELLVGGTAGDNCGHVGDTAQRIYFTQKILNDDGDYVHFLAYTSRTVEDRYYFGFEDLFRGGDNDFEDLLVYAEGLVPDCIPKPEACNGSDDDCDGTADDGLTRPCSTICGSGTETCAGGAYAGCTAPTPTAESCNGTDDDCDGEADEGLTRACSSVCEVGTEYCIGGTFVDCNARTPSPEVCNGIDDDCDGTPDDENPGGGATCGTDTGVCSFGAETCLGGAIVCAGGVSASAEVCNGLDDDCDGTPDEGDPGGGATCGTNAGECTAGVTHCTSGTLRCTGEVGSTPELCDGLDNDCDGTPDDGNPGGGAVCGTDAGECDQGTVTCSGGTLVCAGGTLPAPEECDGLDNDCDGVTDEGNPGGGAECGPIALDGVGICRAGMEICVTTGPGSASVQCLDAVWPGIEVCNGLDDDCDTAVDSPLAPGGPCGEDEGECDPGTLVCVAGAWICAGGAGPVDEACNGLDDDCDGAADEGNPGGDVPCGSDVGECEPGLTYCDATLVPPTIVCLGEVGPEAEICDGFDNDCNHLVDDGLPLGDACGPELGACEQGRWECFEGDLVCAGGIPPAGAEVCDGIDADCDGIPDDEVESPCPDDPICVVDYCAGPCDPTEEWPCPTGRVCDAVDGFAGWYCVGDPCEGVSCPAGERCSGGECVSLCEGVTCPPGQECVIEGGSATCVPSNCYVAGHECGEGERCHAGVCEPDPCWGVDCLAGEFCREGDCFEVCGPEDSCPDGHVCYDGSCVDDLCAAVECSGGWVCDPDTGSCGPDPCEAVSCPWPLVCLDGECVDEECSWIVCPEGHECVDGSCYDVSTLPEPDPEPDSYPDGPPDAGTGQEIAATGTGGCVGCTLTGSETTPESILWVSLAFALLAIARIARQGRAIRAILCAALISSASAGCSTTPYCLGTCDGADGTTDGPGDSADPSAEADGSGDADVDDAVDTPDADTADVEAECTPGAEELCNGVDDDCDDIVDEGFDLDTDLSNCGECGNRCELPHAYPECAGGECVIDPERGCDVNYHDCEADDPGEPESMGCETYCIRTRDDDAFCDHYDNDCDCVADEDVDLLADVDNCGECGTRCRFPDAVPECSSATGLPLDAGCGILECLPGYHDLDEGEPGGLANGCEYECTACEDAEGICVPGRTCCTAAGGETCNGLDDDCDGEVDEGDPGGGGSCGTDEGECTAGTERCTGGAIACEGGTGPAGETCNGLDDDCDAAVDEPDTGLPGLPDEGRPCGEATGECEQGLTVCAGGSIGCQGGTGPAAEACDGRDNDCNGLIDDGAIPGMGTVCGSDEGSCATGIMTCVGGVPVCAGEIVPAVETCNGLDDDCDAVEDDGDPGGGVPCGTDAGECTAGTVHCVLGSPACEGEAPPGVEECNGLDDDCDGTADDGDPGGGGACGTDVGECSAGILHCTGGTLDCTGETGPTPETCDGQDDDCDGTADEGDPGGGVRCGTNVGRCEYGTSVCAGGSLQCPDDVEPIAEACNGVDDDCDAIVDDGMTPPGICDPDGACAGTVASCDGAPGWRCHYPAAYQSTETWCDARDNDCDGAADEGCPSFPGADVWLDADTTNSTSHSVATDGNLAVHVAWLDRRNGEADIYYRGSVDGGSSWPAGAARIESDTAGASASVSPVIAAGWGNHVATAWEDFRGHATYRDVYTNWSSSAGGAWASPDERADDGLDRDCFGVDIAMDDTGGVYVAFEYVEADRSRRIYVAASIDGGDTFSAPVRVDGNSGPAPQVSSDPRIAVDGAGAVFVVWRDNRGGGGDVYFQRSLDRGATWLATDARLDSGTGYSDAPRIAADASGRVYVVWQDDRSGAVDVYASASANRGTAWTGERRLDSDAYVNDSLGPRVAALDGGFAWVVWEDRRDGLPDAYLDRTTDGGVTWLATDVKVNVESSGVGAATHPVVAADGTRVYVAWEDDRSGALDVYMNFSLDSGAAFQPADFRVDGGTAGQWDSQYPEIAAAAGRLHVVWLDYRNAPNYNGDIYYRLFL